MSIEQKLRDIEAAEWREQYEIDVESARADEEWRATYDIEYAAALELTDEQLKDRHDELAARAPSAIDGAKLHAARQIIDEREVEQDPLNEELKADRAAAAAEAAAELLAERRREREKEAERSASVEAHQAGRSMRAPEHGADHTL